MKENILAHDSNRAINDVGKSLVKDLPIDSMVKEINLADNVNGWVYDCEPFDHDLFFVKKSINGFFMSEKIS